MMYFNTIKKTVQCRLVLIAALLLSGMTALAATTFSIGNFSIKPGATKEVPVMLTTSSDDLYDFRGDISLPAGLEFVGYSSTQSVKFGSLFSDPTSVAGGIVFNASTFAVGGTEISGTNGTLFTFQVKASENFQGGTLSISGRVKHSADKSWENAKGSSATVTVDGSGGDDPTPGPTPGPDDPTIDGYTISFSQSSVTVYGGETSTIDVVLENEAAVTGFLGALSANDGITITGVAKAGRTGNPQFSATSGNVLYRGAISGNSGALFTVTFTADEDFVGQSSITFSGISLTTAGAQSIPADDVTVTVNVLDNSQQGDENVVFDFGQQEVYLGAGNSVDVDVLMTNEPTISGFLASLVLPEGITAAVTGGRAGNVQYSATSGNLFYRGAISGNSGVLFTLTLTADESFDEDAVVQLNNISVTTANSKSYEPAAITLTIKAKDEAAYQAALDIIEALRQQLADKIAEIEEEYPDAADDEDLLDDEAAIDRAIDILAQGIEDGYEANDLDLDEIEAAAEEISADIEALEAKAQEIQEAIDAQKAAEEANKAGYANLLDEIAELIEKLEEAEAQIPGDLPKSVDEAFDDESFDILMDIDDLRDAADDAFVNGELTADSHLDPAAKKAILDDIAALLAEIKKWLRGDVAQNQVVEMPDFYALADSILNENLPTDKEGNAFYRFDANADQELNVGDMQGIVNIVLGMDAYGNAARQAEAIEASLSVETMKIGNITRYTLNLTGMEYTAFQMDVNGRVVAENADGVSLRSADLKNGSHRVLGIGTKNDGTVLCIDVEGQAQFSNIVFTTASAQTVKFSLGTTGIASVKAAAEGGQAYDLSGRAVKNAKGVVIVDGKKVIR